MALPNKATEKFANLIKGKGILAALQYLCPIDLHFQIIANATFKKKTHDIIILLSLQGNASGLLQEPKDVETFISGLLSERGSQQTIECEKVLYDKQIYMAIFLDRPQT
jgi:hypothetical protein